MKVRFSAKIERINNNNAQNIYRIETENEDKTKINFITPTALFHHLGCAGDWERVPRELNPMLHAGIIESEEFFKTAEILNITAAVYFTKLLVYFRSQTSQEEKSSECTIFV